MLRSRRKVVGHVALTAPSLGRLPAAPEDLEAQRDGVTALFGSVAALKDTGTGADARVVSDAAADRLIVVCLELIGHDLTPRRTRLSDAAHFGRLVALLEPSLHGFDADRSHPHAATALTYVAVQTQDADKLFEQLSIWALQAGYWLTRTGVDSNVLLDALRAELRALLAQVEPAIPRQRRGTQDDIVIDVSALKAAARA